MTAARILVLGGSGFIGATVVRALRARGHDVVSLSRRGDPAATFAAELRVDRRDAAALAAALEGARFDATIDCCAYDSTDVERLLLVPHAALGRYLLISSGQVYLVTQSPAVPAREEDSDRPLMPEPAPGTRDHAPWAYGVGKRRAESAALALRDSHGVRAVVLRLPVIHGGVDPTLRLWAYLERMLDGGPLLLPDGGRQLTRYLWVDDVPRAVLRWLEIEEPRAPIYNLAQPEMATLREFLRRVSRIVAEVNGRDEARWVEIAGDELEREGLDPAFAPLSGRWSSVMDPGQIAEEWGFVGTSLDEWLPIVVRQRLEHPPGQSHSGYARRGREIEVAARRPAMASA